MTGPQGEKQPGMGLTPRAPQTAVVAAETAATAVAAREKAAVEARYLVAMRTPRNPDNARIRLLNRCESKAFAGVAEYSKPVGGGKTAKGASIRMMEEIARHWGNIDVQSPVVFDDHERRIIRVTCTDLESNYAASTDIILEKTVERRNPRGGDEVLGSRVNSKGETVYRIAADEDAFLVKQNANVAKARREMIRAIVPGDLVEEAIQLCADTRRREVTEDPAGARKRIADAFYSIGVMPAQLCEYLDKPSLEAVTDAELEVLRAIYTAMKEGETTWKEVMAEKHPESEKPETASAAAPGTEGMRAKLGGRKKNNGSAVGGAGSAEAVGAQTTPSVTPAPQQSDEDRLLALDDARLAAEGKA